MQPRKAISQAIAAATAASLLVACGEGNKYVAPPPPRVTVATPTTQPVTRYLEATGNTAAVNSTESPGLSLPFWTASDMAVGMVAAELLPYKATTLIVRSGAIPRRAPVSSIIRVFAWCGIHQLISQARIPACCNAAVPESAIA